MKKIYSTIAILAISSLAFLSSCSNNNEEEMITPVSPDVTVTLNENSNTSETKMLYVKRDKMNAVVQVNGITNTTKDLKRIYVYKKVTTLTGGTITTVDYVNYNGSGFKKEFGSSTNYYYEIPSDQKNNASLTLTLTLNANNTAAISDEYYFAFTDGTDFVGPADTNGMLLGPAKIVVVYGALSETTGHKLNNINGPNSGAFDLENLSNRAGSDAADGKDMVDADAATALWEKSFNAGTSGTLFAKIPAGFDYDNATDMSIKAAYDAANTANSTQLNVAKGYMYVAKYNSTKYALIKVTSISDETNGFGPGLNNEFMEFSVKK